VDEETNKDRRLLLYAEIQSYRCNSEEGTEFSDKVATTAPEISGPQTDGHVTCDFPFSSGPSILVQLIVIVMTQQLAKKF
jgi:hypothetical protein